MSTTSVEPDLSEFLSEQTGYRGPTCTVAAILAQLDPQKAASLEAALASSLIQHTAIAKTLKKWGYTLDPSGVSRHRHGGCRCARA